MAGNCCDHEGIFILCLSADLACHSSLTAAIIINLQPWHIFVDRTKWTVEQLTLSEAGPWVDFVLSTFHFSLISTHVRGLGSQLQRVPIISVIF